MATTSTTKTLSALLPCTSTSNLLRVCTFNDSLKRGTQPNLTYPPTCYRPATTHESYLTTLNPPPLTTQTYPCTYLPRH